MSVTTSSRSVLPLCGPTQHGSDATREIRRDPHAAAAPEHLAEAPRRQPHGRRVHDGHQLIEVIAQHAVEQVLVAILQGGQLDVLLERIVVGADRSVNASRLHRHRDVLARQQPFQPEGSALGQRKTRALVVQWLAQQRRSAQSHLEREPAGLVAIQVEAFHDCIIPGVHSCDSSFRNPRPLTRTAPRVECSGRPSGRLLCIHANRTSARAHIAFVQREFQSSDCPHDPQRTAKQRRYQKEIHMNLRLRIISPRLAIALTACAVAGAAQAVPSYARQVGVECNACHTAFPQLTAFGREFKLGGYTTTTQAAIEAKDAQTKELLSLATFSPISVMFQVADSNTAKALPDTQNNDAAFPQEASLFLAGRLSPKVGTFLQMTYDGAEDKFGVDNVEFRFANHSTVSGKEVEYGLTLNNNPTIEDLWNTTPVWGFPWSSSGSAPTPAASALIEGNLGQSVAGLGGYAMWNEAFYGAFTLYRSAQLGSAAPNADSESTIAGAAPYWRFAWQHTMGTNYLELGTYGMRAKLYPSGISGMRDEYTDVAGDFQFEHSLGTRRLTVHGSYIAEDRKLDASFDAGAAERASNHLDVLRLDAGYLFGRWQLVGGYFAITGGSDAALYPALRLTAARRVRPTAAATSCRAAISPGAMWSCRRSTPPIPGSTARGRTTTAAAAMRRTTTPPICSHGCCGSRGRYPDVGARRAAGAARHGNSRVSCWQLQSPCQPFRRAYEVCQRGLVEVGVEAAERAGEHAGQLAVGRDATGVAIGEALDDGLLAFRVAHDLADAYLLRRHRQPDAATAPAHGFDEPALHQVVHDLHQVIPGDVESVGDGLDGGALLLVHGQVDQHPQGVVGKGGQAHGIASYRAGAVSPDPRSASA